jgi:hypothetical protein
MVRSGAGLLTRYFGIVCRHGMEFGGCFIPSLASHRLADCFSFVVSTSCSIAILTFV